jgi:2-keto-4-pentenoate hydratase/2-oxohepta-3-ene-1,7-dioic acid hydratase in catechol pathway
MKLLRVGPAGHEQPALLDSAGRIRSLAAVIPDLAGDALSHSSLERLRAIKPESLPLVEGDVRIGPCVGQVGKFMCIGLNYAEHAAETGISIPAEPVLFMKATSAICGPNDDLQIPRGSNKTDWEVELGVVIGERAKYVTEEDALHFVAGYCTVHDVSEREYQMERCGQWTKGKSCDTFGPIGPWLVTKDEVPDPQNLGLWLEVDGHRHQNGTTKTMIFGVRKLVSYLSEFMTLHPGDIISTGTPSGVGMSLKPSNYLRPGRVVRLGVDGLGEQHQRTVQG